MDGLQFDSLYSQAHYYNQSVFVPHQSQSNPDYPARSRPPASGAQQSSSSGTIRDERLPSSARLSHLETPQVGAEGEFVGPEGGDPASLVTELSLRTFLSWRTGGEDGEERGAREEQEEQSSGRHDGLWTTENICRSGAATEQGPVSQDQDHHDHR